MKTSFTVGVVIAGMAIVLPAWGLLPSKTAELGNYDKRVRAAVPVQGLTASSESAVAALKISVPDVRISKDSLLGTPSQITAAYGFLTGPGGRGVSDTSLAAFPADDPHRVVKAFLNEHAALFGHDAGVLSSTRIQRDYVTERNGLRTTVWEQLVDGIPVFEGTLVGNITRKGELVNISSHLLADAPAAATRGNANRSTLVNAPTVSPAAAIANAARNINAELNGDAIVFVGAAQGPEKSQKANVSGLLGSTPVQLVWLPMDSQTMRLCWRVILISRASPEQFLVLVDAETGEVMVRHSLTAHIEPASFNVYTSDSPSPFSPGWPTPQSEQPTNQLRTMVAINALDANASPQGWVPDGGNTTSGNNIIAFVDRDLSGTPDIPLPQGAGTNRVFDYPLNLTNQPINYRNASTVQLFYEGNWYHDRLYQLGFTEAAGNFQVDNLGRGGFGDDNVIGLVQAGADVGYSDNSAFSTPPDGQNGYCFMFVFTGPMPNRDGSLDEEVVCHELTHGTSNRLLGGGAGISQLQTEGMGEGWSDFYALCLLSEPTDDVDAVYATGGYASYRLVGLDFTENYYFGIRRYPYTTDMTKNPLTFQDIDPTHASAHLGVPISPLFGGTDPSEVHNQGEVWCMTLREVWASLVSKWGWNIGNELALQLVTDGLRLGPANATFLEARDAIIQADLVDSGGENYSEIWTAFAKRGMGYSASCPPSDTTIGVLEAFDLPPDVGTPDGILEVKVTPPSDETMFAGETNVIFVRVTDARAVTNATITATISSGTDLVFHNDGVAPDQTANNAVYSAELIVPTNQSSITINLVVSAPGKDTSTNLVTYFIVPLPLNDNFANATKVPAQGTAYLTNNKKGTTEPSEPLHAAVLSEQASLWWNYTAAANTNILVDTAGSLVRTVVAVYTNNSLTALRAVGSAAGSLTRPGAFVSFNAKAGITYHIAVAGYDSNNVGTLSVNIAPGAQADVTVPTVTITSPLNGQIVNTNRVLLSGTASDPAPNASGIKEIAVRVVRVPGVQASSETVLSSLTGPLNTNWLSIIGLSPGLNDVQVVATDYAGNKSVTSSIQINYRMIDPVNDFFVKATVITNTAGTNSVNTQNATRESGEPNHAGSLASKSAWWSFTAPQDGVLTLSTSNSTFDTVLAIYQGNSVSQLTNVASNDDAYEGAPGGFSQIVQPVKSNQTYRIAVDGYDAQSGVVFLTYDFNQATLFHVTIASTMGGTVSPAAVDIQSNGTVTVTATPDSNYRFDIWDGSLLSVNNPFTFTVTSDLNLTAHFRPIEYSDSFESGDLLGLNWTSGGNKPWVVQTNSVAAGMFAARSGIIANNQSSSLILSGVFRAGTGSFDYKVSSEPSFDVFRFYVDGLLQQQWSGEAGWANYGFSIAAGNHTLEWRYSKDANGAAGVDAAFLDNVNLPLVVNLNGSSAASLQLQRQSDGTFLLNLTGQTNQQYILQSSTNLTSWQNLTTNIAVGGFLRFPDPAVTNQLRFYRAVAAP